jgi:hypothetical protein
MRLFMALITALMIAGVIFSACGSPAYPDELERRKVEKAYVQTAVRALMVDEGLSDLSRYADGTPTGAPVWTYAAGNATNDMTVFPSPVWGLHSPPDRRYVWDGTTEYFYTVELDGTVRQFADLGKTEEYRYD